MMARPRSRPRSRPRLAAALAFALLLPALAGCGSSPGGFAARFTDRGRLLLDGPPARMNAAAVAQDRANEVPLLYEFAVEAGEIPPRPGQAAQPAVPFPATDIASQQVALAGVQDWRPVTLVGEAYVDKQCNRFVAALEDLERTRRTTLSDLNAVQGATVGIMGLALAAQKAIGIVGISFGLAASLFETTTSTVLYQLPASGVASIVEAQRQFILQNQGPALAGIDSQGAAAAQINQYVRYCVPVTIEANIAKLLDSSKGTRAGITGDVPQPIVVPAVMHDAAFRASLPTRTALRAAIAALDGRQVLALARAMEPNLAGSGASIRRIVRTLDPRDQRLTDPATARTILEIWVATSNDVTSLVTWRDAVAAAQDA
jgi:hypothetical protein